MSNIITSKKEILTLYDTINEAYASFVLYDFLRKMQGTKRRVKIFNHHALLFSHLRNIALYDFTLKITKTMDSAQTGSHENLTFPFLSESIEIHDKQLKNTANQLLDNIYDNLVGLKKLRNKHLAHLDRSLNRDELFSKSKTLTARKILNNQLKLLNIFKNILEEEQTSSLHFDLETRDIGMLWKDLFLLSKVQLNNEQSSIL